MKNDRLIRFSSKRSASFYQLRNKWKSRQACLCLIRKYQWNCSVLFSIVLLREDENSFAVELLIVFPPLAPPPLFSQTESSFPISLSFPPLSLASNIGLVLVDSYKIHSLIERNHLACCSIINFYLVLHFNISNSEKDLHVKSYRHRRNLWNGTLNY